ncbi:hypothetical protein CJU60_15495 [Bacillus sp. 7705b]|nr:hypothetical protein CJU60_15495 [Bacillus sp. 7705b]
MTAYFIVCFESAGMKIKHFCLSLEKIKTAPQMLKMADLIFPHPAADTPAINKNQKLRMLCTRFCYMKINILPHPSPYFAVYQKPHIGKNAKQSEPHTKKADIRTRRESDT